MSYVDGLVAGIDGALEGADAKLDQLKVQGPGVIRRLVDLYFELFPLVPSAMKNEVVARLVVEMDAAIAYAHDNIVECEKLAKKLGSPDALRAGAAALDAQVNKASNDLAANVRPDSLVAMDDSSKWDGAASELYSKSFVGQSQAVARIEQYGKLLEDALGHLADAIEQYYIELLAAVLTLAAAIAQAVLAILIACGVVTVPFGLALAITACITALGTIGSVIAMFITIGQEVGDSIGDLHSDLTPWPTAKFAS
jgi:hypothetical protein